MKEAAPGLVKESGLKEALNEGFSLEVVCQEEPERRYNAWYGVWIVRAVSEDGTVEKLLVTEREGHKSEAELRQFKTAIGVISFLYSLGFRSIGLPFEKGRRFPLQNPAK